MKQSHDKGKITRIGRESVLAHAQVAPELYNKTTCISQMFTTLKFVCDMCLHTRVTYATGIVEETARSKP